ncbi:MAG: hypothetical protein QXX34_08055 [Candidatus Bathyarchaeia archaeon]
MILQKTVKAKLFSLTRIKEEKISREYWNFQKALKGEDVPLYSATKQQAQRKQKKWNGIGEFPLIIRRDCFKVKELGLKLSKWWARVPVYGGASGVRFNFLMCKNLG